MSETGGILVTGADGFVSGWLVKALRDIMPGAEIIAATREGRSGARLDVSDERAVSEFIRARQPSAVVNLAALSFVPEAEEQPREAFQVNLFGTMHLASAILREVPDCRLVFVGSSEVYGGSFHGSEAGLTEAALLNPTNIYASTKAAADLLMGQYALRGLKVVRFRPFNHIGPGQSDRFVVASFARQIAAAEQEHQPPCITVGNLDTVRDFLDVRDVARSYALAIARPDPLPPGTILNIASGRPRRIRDVLDLLLRQARIPLEVRTSPDLYRPTEISFAVGDASAARRLLGWEPQIPFETTLAQLLDAARSACEGF